MTDGTIELLRNDGTTEHLSDYEGNVLLVVNLASKCGFTPQYEALEALQQKYADRGFTVLGFPSNQFLQEGGSDEEIAEYCRVTWGVTFPVFEKAKVNGRNRHPLYRDIIDAKDTVGLAGPVLWNFEKFLILPNGEKHRFRTKTEPDDPALVSLIEANLPR
ncbi:glutathione peroxidase [Mycetocola lacteus]|uniref:Glutathione peroxidase n=1 Tax=Mycetocola lacteus TaxID=76637 RepID=A0A3L7AFM4_9MICO|nr:MULTISPECIES: glutathione peroxidase [Mycetocola]MCS4277979.1 glutathione peroxidase [Mycetocola sp. BIGb0189]RLP78804.1 glutathione peroxidase [Mycetocola lacteus]